MKKIFLLLIMLFCFSGFAFSQAKFTTGNTIDMLYHPRIVQIGDVNNDKLDDLLVMATDPNFNSKKTRVYAYLQNKDGNLLDPVIYFFPAAPSTYLAMSIADVNNDALNDVIVGYGDSIGVFYQNKTGKLDPVKSYYSGRNILSLKTGDLNNDGLTDIAVSHMNETFVSVFHQQTQGFSKDTFNTTAGGYELEIADVNSDGLNDVILTVKIFNPGIHVLTQDSEGKLVKNAVYTTLDPLFNTFNGIAVGDMNNDGTNDIVASKNGNTINAKIFIWYQDTVTKLLKSPEIIQAMDVPEAIEVADMNCDGKPEIFIAHGGWPYVTVFQQDINGKYNSYDEYKMEMESHINPQGISYGDINNDEKNDIVTIGYGNKVQLLYNISPVTARNNRDTLTRTDTIFTATDTTKQFFTTATYDTVGWYVFTKTDSFQLINIYRKDSFRLDSIFTRSFCAKPYSDSSTRSYFYSQTRLIKQDTIFISSTTDSLLMQPQLSGEINGYPNPTSGKLFLGLDTVSLNGAEVFVNVFNDKGKLVLSKTISDGTKDRDLDLSTLRYGLYYVVLRYNSATYTRKIIKNK